VKMGRQRKGATLFTHLIFSFTLLAVVLIGLVGSYLYVQANRLMVDEISRDSRQRLETSSEFVENTVLQKFENSIRNRAVSTLSLESQSMLNYLLDSKWEGNTAGILAFRKDLEIFKVTNEGVYKITAYFEKGNYIIDNSQFYAKLDNSPDAAFLNDSLPLALNRWTYRTLSDGEEVLTYAIALPYGSLSKTSAGAMYIDVSLEYINQLVSSTMSSPLEKLYAFNDEGKSIIHTGLNDEEGLSIAQKWMESDEKDKEVHYNKRGQYVLSYMSDQASNNQWKYVLIRPMNTFVSSSEQLKGQIFSSCLLVLLIGLFISYIISRRVYVPMKRLVSSIRSFYQPTSPYYAQNEYAMIGSTISTLGQKIESLEFKAKENELKNLVLGAGIGSEFYDYLPQQGHYMISYIRILEGEGEALKAYFEQQAAYRDYKFVSLNAQEAAVIYFSEQNLAHEEMEQMLLSEMKQMKNILAEQVRFGAAIGSLVEAPEEISFSYQSALHAYRYRFFYGREAIVLHSQMPTAPLKPPFISFEVYKNALKAGNVVAMNRFLDDFQKTMENGDIPLETVELGLLQMVTVLYQSVIELDLQQMVPPSRLFDELKKETLAETLESIRALSAQMTAHVQEAGNHAHTEIILKLKTFIDEHIHEDLSLHKLSEVASLAPSYISTLFGAVMNESFTEYVTRVRLEKAARLLREDKRLSVAEISGRVGYRNPQYFHNKFKSRYGVTPVQYRNVGSSSA
jgi:two-component system response regulator YesN